VTSGLSTFTDSTNSPDSSSAYEVFAAQFPGSSSVRAALSQSVVPRVGTAVPCSWAYKFISGDADYVEVTFYVDGQHCIDLGDTPGSFTKYSGSVSTLANPSVVTIWLGADIAGSAVTAAFDTVSLVKARLPACPV
jgi:hypothetical protein